MSSVLNKIDIPSSTLETLPNINNKTGEARYINELVFNKNRTNQGQVSWTSDTSGIVYNTENSSDVDVYDCGETGLLNLLQHECSDFLLSASDFKSLGEHYNIVPNSSFSGGRYYKIAQISRPNTVDYLNQLSLLVGGIGRSNTDIRNYLFIDFSANNTGANVNVTHFTTTKFENQPASIDRNLVYCGYVVNDSSNKIELWIYLATLVDSMGITIINNNSKGNTNDFEIGDLTQVVNMPNGLVRAGDQHLIKNTDISNPNILINTNFRSPINQRHLSSYKTTTNTTSLYTIDRWRLESAINDVELKVPASGDMTTGIVFNIPVLTSGTNSQVNFLQELPIENFQSGGIYTLQINVNSTEYISDLFVRGNDNGVISAVANGLEYQIDTTTNEQIVSLTFTLPENQSFKSIIVGITISANTQLARTISLYWAKLEKGYIKTKYLLPDYNEEYIRCCGYYYVLNGVHYSGTVSGDSSTNWIWKNLTTSSSTILTATFEVPVPMRIVPTISFANLFAAYFTNSTTSAYATAITVNEGFQRKIVCNLTMNVSISAGLAGVLILRDVNTTTPPYNAYVVFDAEL